MSAKDDLIRPIPGLDSIKTINRAIAVPNPGELASADGRIFLVKEWSPYVATGETLTVTATFEIQCPKGSS